MLDHFTAYGYVGVFAALVAAGFGLPVPEELPVLTAGVLVGHADTLAEGATELDPNRLRWWIMLPMCILGVVIGDGVLYTIGRIWGPRLLNNAWVQRNIVSPETRAKIEKNFQERGVLILLTARLTPGIRTPVFMMAGILHVPVGRFLLADGIYAIPGVSTLFFLAYIFTDQALEVFNQLQRNLEHYRSFVVVGVMSFGAGILCHRFVISRHVTTGAASEVPLMNWPMEKVTEAATHAVEKTVGQAVQAVEKTIEAVTHMKHPEKPNEPPTVVK